MTDRFDKFTEGARKILQLAQEEAGRFDHKYIGTEHILLGLLREGGIGVTTLSNLGVDAARIRSAVEFIIGRGDRMVMGEAGLTPRSKRVIELAVDEARRLNHHYIGTEHLLLGLMREGEGIAAGVMESLGLTLEKIRREVKSKVGAADRTVGEFDSEQDSGQENQSTRVAMTDRFDRFTERTRKTLQFAQEEAKQFGHSAIGPEHIFLGLLREGDGVAARVLDNLGLEVVKMRSAVDSIMGRDKRWVFGEVGMTEAGKQVLVYAVEEARALNHHYVGTEHLLLGLVRQQDGIVAGLLSSMGISLERVREQVTSVISSSSGYAGRADPNVVASTEAGALGRFDKFTEGARKTLQLAQEEAQRFNHNYIGTEHILLGLTKEQDGVAARVLNNLGIELSKVRSAVEFIIGSGERMVMGEIGLTPRAKRVLELAVDEARRLKHHYIGTEHLLLGLVREGEGIAAGILESLGVSLQRVREGVLRVLSGSSEDATRADKPVSYDLLRAEWQNMLSNAERAEPKVYVSIEMLRTMFDYLIWARDQLLPLIQGLEEGKMKEVPAELQKGLYGSIHDTLAHMAQSEWLWVQRCLGESPLRLPKGEDFADLAAILDWWNTVHADAVQLLNVISEDDLQSEITYLAPDGKRRTRKIWHMLVQVPNHQTEHRSQLATMLGSMGLEVPPTDMVVYLSQLGG